MNSREALLLRRDDHGRFARQEATICTVDDCQGKPRGKGLCNKHLVRLQRNGHTDYTRTITPNPVRFWRTVKLNGQCWEWQGARNPKGYGQFSLKPEWKVVLAHRFSYEHMVADIPDGIALDHLCLNKACVNPSHLDPVTAAINTTRYYQALAPQTTCKRGHELPPLVPGKRRNCKECRNANERAKRKAVATNGR